MNKSPEKIHQQADIYTACSESLKQLNTELLKGFLKHYQRDDVKRTHLFNGRYENIYLDENDLPILSQFKTQASELANKILGTEKIDMGYWFNYMPAGAVTTAHRHDDDDELLSAAYYISVPKNSGDLVIKTNNETVKITPEEGCFIFFKPDMVHEVTENLSTQDRLSIGINFGHRRREN